LRLPTGEYVAATSSGDWERLAETEIVASDSAAIGSARRICA
jgi:hypothetical protein